jgi:hypothetical protein
MFEEWKAEMRGMAGRIMTVRGKLRAALEKRMPERSWAFITEQIGMFSYTGMSEKQVREEERYGRAACLKLYRRVQETNGGTEKASAPFFAVLTPLPLHSAHAPPPPRSRT